MNVSGGSAATLNQLVKRQLLECYEVEVGRLNHGGPYRPELVKPLSAAQQDAYNKIQLSMLKKRVTLLHGVTSSGKTEIYIHLIQQALERKEQVLFLMPEIALTVQMMQRLQRVFGDRLGIYHSRYSDAERVEIWPPLISNQLSKKYGRSNYPLIPMTSFSVLVRQYSCLSNAWVLSSWMRNTKLLTSSKTQSLVIMLAL